MNYKIISDGCCDLAQDIIDRYQLDIVPFYISFDEKNFYRENEEIEIREVYDRMVREPDVYPRTSLPTVQNYIDAFMPYVEEDIPVVCICFTPHLSGSYNSACSAKDIVCEICPRARISVINSEAATVSQGLLVIEAGRMLTDGIPYEECVDILERMKKTNRVFFTIANLDYMVHGGRIGKLAAMATGALALKPLITLRNGAIESSGLGRSRGRTREKLIAMLKRHFRDTGDSMEDYNYAVGFGYDKIEGKEFGKEVAKHIAEHIAERKKEKLVSHIQIGATIAVHTGPHALGIGIIKRYEHFRLPAAD